MLINYKTRFKLMFCRKRYSFDIGDNVIYVYKVLNGVIYILDTNYGRYSFATQSLSDFFHKKTNKQ